MKRELYNIKYDGIDACGIYRIDQNIGLLGFIFEDGYTRQDYYSGSHKIPKYIIKEALGIMQGVQ